MILADLELDLDVFQGPFDLLLALVLREEVELADVPIAEIVVAYVERAYEKGELDLESASEFLVLMAALLEIKVRLLFPGEVEEDDLSPEQAEAELFQRLIEYRRFQGAAAWLRDRTAGPPRVFRIGPAPLAPRPEPVVVEFSEDPWQLAAAVDRLLVPPPHIDVSSVRRPLVPVERFLDHFRTILRTRRGFQFEEAVKGLDRLSQAAAFLALLEMIKRGEVVPEQPRLFAPIRVVAAAGAAAEADVDARPGDRVSELTHTVEALLFVASEPLTPKELAELTDAAPERIERALGALADRHCEGRSGVVLERVAGGYGLRAARETAEVCARLVNRPSAKGLSQAALETLAIVAYLQPVSRPEIARIRGVGADSAVGGLIERGLIEEAGRADTPGTPVVYRTTSAFLRVFGLGEGEDLPALSDFELTEADHQALRARLHLVADQRAGQA